MERKKTYRKNVKCPKTKLNRICLKESFHREKRDKEKPCFGLKNSRKFKMGFNKTQNAEKVAKKFENKKRHEIEVFYFYHCVKKFSVFG
jgi:hypothetical protein